MPPQQLARLVPDGLSERATDTGNAIRFAHQHGDSVRYAGGRFYVWDGRRWAFNATGEIERMAKATARAIITEANFAASDELRRSLTRHALASESAQRRRAMLELARSELPIACRLDAFNRDKWLFNASTGTIDLRTGVLTPHSRDDFLTKICGAAFDAGAPCPVWESFLSRIFDGNADLIRFVQRAVGYSLVGVTSEHSLFFLYGTGANGKTTFIEVIKAVFGEYATTADFTAFATRRNSDGPRNDLARLHGARLVTATEFGAGRQLDEVLTKQITGGDTVAARFLWQESFEFEPEFSLWLAGNHRPVVKGTDEAIWRRIKLVPFSVTIPEAERDAHLRERLLEESSGILAWAVRGCLDWQENGLHPPSEVLAATADYRAESDTIGPFLEARTVAEPRASVKAADLFRAYQTWTATQGEEAVSQSAFGMRLTEKGFGTQQRGGGSRWRVGLRLRGESELL
jgi:putative DNA primase/helicase